MMKDVAKALIEKADKNTLMNIVNDILEYEDNYDNPITQYVIAKCIGKPSLTIVDVDMDKLNEYAKSAYKNKYYTLVEGTVELISVNPITRTVKVGYECFENEAEDKTPHKTTSDININYHNILKNK